MNHGTSKEVIRDGVIAGMFFSLSMVSPNGAAITLEELAAKVERLEAENRALKEQVGKLASSQAATQPAAAAGQAATAASPPAPATGGVGNGVTFNSRHTYQMLDPTTYINRKHLLLLDGRKSGELAENSFTLAESERGEPRPDARARLMLGTELRHAHEFEEPLQVGLGERKGVDRKSVV